MSDIEKQQPHSGDDSASKEESSRASVVTCISVPLNTEAKDGLDVANITNLDITSASNTVREGSAKAYLTVFGAFLALFCTFGQMNAYGTFQTWYAAHQLSTLPPSTISWVGSIQLWVFFFSGGPIGLIFDKYGPRSLMLAGTLCYVLSIMMTSISTKYYQYILSQGLLFGLGVGLLSYYPRFYPSLSSISTYFDRYRATAVGIAVAGSGLGGVVFPIMLQNLFITVGFGWATRISGLLCGVLCGVAVLIVTRAPPRIFPAGDNASSSTAQTNQMQAQQQSRPVLAGLNCLKDSRYMVLTAGGGLVALGCFIPYFYIVDYAQNLSSSISQHTSFVVLAVMNAGGVFGRLAPSILSDRLGRFNLLALACFFAGILILTSWMFARNLATLMVFSLLYGVFSGAFISLVTPCVAQISDIREIGCRIGMLYTIISFPALIGGPVAGLILTSSHGSYTGTIVFSGTSVVVGSLLIFGTKLMIDRRVFARV